MLEALGMLISERAYKSMGMLTNQNSTNQAPTMRIKGTISEQTDKWMPWGAYECKPTYVDVEITLHNIPNNSCPDLSPETIVSIIRAIQNSKES